MDDSKYITGFSPIVDKKARVLILGSMPSEASLRKQQYYGHSRNAFWLIMQELFGFDADTHYQQKKKILEQQGVAVWDVLKHCSRKGSLDADIDITSIQVNDFLGFYLSYPLIEKIFFNGGMAEKVYQKNVLPGMSRQFSNLQYQRLPSTSPAYASMSLAAKIAAWQVITKKVI
jgi:hypoxanthine-DNA glycosylase